MTNGKRRAQSRDDTGSRRRYLAAFSGLVGSVALSGCSSDDVDAPEDVSDSDDEATEPTATPDEPSSATPAESSANTDDTVQGTVDAALGDVIEGDRLSLVVYAIERTTTIGEYTEADAGQEFVIVDMAAKNRASSEYIRFSSFLQLTLRDDESYEYDQTLTTAENALDSGELVPGEVTRGVVVFEVPEGTAGLSLEIDLDESAFSYQGATIDLETRGSGRTLTQDLDVPVYDPGDTIEYEQTRLTVNSVRTSIGSEYITPDSGNEFVVIDITVENTGSDELNVSTLLQLALKDDAGRTYDTSLTASSTLDRQFSQSAPIQPGRQRRGEIAFEAPQGRTPLYLVMDFEIFTEGDKTFVSLR